jgi:hypothetical protein
MMKFIRRDHIPTDRRPLGYWLRAIDRPLRENMRGALATFGVTRREWRTLTTLHSGPRSGAQSQEQILDDFVSRGWASLDRGSYALTAEGERVHDAILARVQTVRANVTAGIPDADYATTMATLERIATNVGWDPGQRPVRRGRGHAPKRRPA